MVISHSYVKLPEGNHFGWLYPHSHTCRVNCPGSESSEVDTGHRPGPLYDPPQNGLPDVGNTWNIMVSEKTHENPHVYQEISYAYP